MAALESASDGSLSQSGEASASATAAADDAAAAGGAGGGGDVGGGGDSADKPHVALRNAVETLEVVLSGYAVSELCCRCRGAEERTSKIISSSSRWKYTHNTHNNTR